MNIFLDACILIYWLELKEPYYSKFIAQLAEINEIYPQNEIYISRLSYLECLVKPMQQKNKDLVQQYESIFTNGEMQIVELSEDCIKIATQIKVKYQLKTPDALQVASAMLLDDPAIFISNDISLKKIKELEIKIIGS